MIKRFITPKIEEALSDTPVVFLSGARQTGKTTLVKELIDQGLDAKYVTFDEMGSFSSAQSDPQGFLADAGAGPLVIDEVQKVPELFRAIKLSVDNNRKPGRFLITGSANALVIPKMAESLTGRVELLTMWPLSIREIEDKKEDLIAMLYDGWLPKKGRALSRSEIFKIVSRGGFPDVIDKTDKRRNAWFASYLKTSLERDLRDVAQIQDVTKLSNLLVLCAARSGRLSDVADLSRSLSIPYTTLVRYVNMLEALYLVHTVPAWSTNVNLRIVKSPKVFMGDTGMLTHLLATDEGRLEVEPTLYGSLTETLVAAELKKALSYSEVMANLYHFRTHGGQEVDFLIEGPGGDLIAIEVKSANSLTSDSSKGLKYLKEVQPKRFKRGIILYAGSEVIPMGSGIHAIPLSNFLGI